MIISTYTHRPWLTHCRFCRCSPKPTPMPPLWRVSNYTPELPFFRDDVQRSIKAVKGKPRDTAESKNKVLNSLKNNRAQKHHERKLMVRQSIFYPHHVFLVCNSLHKYLCTSNLQWINDRVQRKPNKMCAITSHRRALMYMAVRRDLLSIWAARKKKTELDDD